MKDFQRFHLDDQPLAIRYHKQLKEKGIPEWAPDDL